MSRYTPDQLNKKRAGYILVPVLVEYNWTGEDHPYCSVTRVEAPSAEDCQRSYAAQAIVYKTKDEAFKDALE